MTPKDAATKGLGIYQTEMRAVIRQRLQREFGADWCQTQVAPLFGGRKKARMLKGLEKGERPEDRFDIGEFRMIIAKHQSLFPAGIREGEHHNHMDEIANRRNGVVHALGPVYRANAQEFLGWCIEVLEQCGSHPAAGDIRDIASALAAAQGAVPAQSATPWPRRIPRWGRGVLVCVAAGIVLLIYFLELRDSPQQQVFDRIDCSPADAETGETVHCSPVSESPDLLRVPDTFYWRGGGDPATGNDTEFKTIFEDSGRYVIQLNVRSGDGHEGHGIEVEIAERSANQELPRTEPEPEPTAQDDLQSLEPSVQAPRPPESSFARCGSDSIRVFYFNTDLGTKHFLDISGEAATRILGASWWNTIGWMSVAECAQWPTGNPYDERDVQEIERLASAQSEGETTGRIAARRLDNGRVEFGWQPTGGARVLPRARYFPADATVGRWLNSSPVEVEGAAIGHINARLLRDGRIEFAFTPTSGQRILPWARVFPAHITHNLWLRSTEITIDPPEDATSTEARPTAQDAPQNPEPSAQAPRPPESSFARCGSDSIRIFYFNTDLGTKHSLDISGEAATRILGVSWWDTIGSMSMAECAQWPTGNPYDERDVQEIASPADSLSGRLGLVTYLGDFPTTASALATDLGTGSMRLIFKCEAAGWGSRFAIIDGVVLPGSEDFAVSSGDALWIGGIAPPDELCGPRE